MVGPDPYVIDRCIRSFEHEFVDLFFPRRELATNRKCASYIGGVVMPRGAGVDQNQTIFFDSLGYSPDLYSYPYGEYDNVMKEVLKMAGFSSATAQYSGILYGGSDLFDITRFPMGGPFATLKGFIQKSQMKPIYVFEKIP